MNAAFIDAITSLPNVCESFHVPLQSGSDRILQAMHRGYTITEYMSRIEAIRERLPQATFTTDVIVGFPGETDQDFAATRDVMNTVAYGMAYIFKYSPRTGTRAAEQVDDVPREVKEQRNQLLLQDLEQRAAAANQRYVGQELEVLVEGVSKRNSERWTGRTRTNSVCIFPAAPDIHPGDLITFKIAHATANSLFAVGVLPSTSPPGN